GAADVEDGERLGKREDVLVEGVDQGAVVDAEPDGDDRLDRPAEQRWIDVRVEAAHHPALAKTAQPDEAARRREPDLRGKLLVRDPRVLLQREDEGAIDPV